MPEVKKTRRLIVYLGMLIFLFLSCNSYQKNHSHALTPDANITKGKELAATYCQSCHKLPDPSWLDSKSWVNGVLPSMGPRLGIFSYAYIQYPSSLHDRDLDSNFYPKEPLLDIEQWQYIRDYYGALSPDSLPAPVRKHEVKANTTIFNAEAPPANQKTPTTGFVKIDTTVIPHQLWIGDVLYSNIYRYTRKLSILDSIHQNSPVVDMQILPGSYITCNIGNINPNNAKLGSINRLQQGKKLEADSSFLLAKLGRPVQLCAADLNGDHQTDYLVCEFGNLTGALSWYEYTGTHTYNRHVLRNFPGAIKAYIYDFNHDGLMDIVALFAQGQEGIFMFTNKGNGQFSQEQLLSFPSVYGSSFFEMDDFNKDGHPDILYTCGDNADNSPVLKPYHGVYVFLNDGTNHFSQKYFFPMFGCYKAIARDFDGDGDLDIAAISFFADYAHHPEQSFIYLQNNGLLDFFPFTVPGTQVGRWLTMDAGDLDGDGKPDLVLGNLSVAPLAATVLNHWKEGPPFLFLKNISGKNQ